MHTASRPTDAISARSKRPPADTIHRDSNQTAILDAVIFAFLGVLHVSVYTSMLMYATNSQ
ncbi:hypothetical protein C2G38_2160083 [Gigaspora rosea]|uniref:Uncharacterized protein n=1 Tax=Gigaspora rosea TaxID=44941 RepID=A0A397W0U5_9GLOM|nr:hypothetical protein C2G38_2160083 [Gigaspora rosea]